jgi:hypothetical protein
MKKYICYINSHSDRPDFEYEVEAENFIEAVREIVAYINNGREDSWDEATIAKFTEEVCPNCGTPLKVTLEVRDGHNYENVADCKDCGYTETN